MAKFLDALPHKHKIIIAGNHDIAMDYSHYDSLKGKWGEANLNLEKY